MRFSHQVMKVIITSRVDSMMQHGIS